MWLIRIIFFLAGAFVGFEVMLVAWLECGFCVRTFHPNAWWISALCSCAVAGYFRAALARPGAATPDESPFLDAASLASGGWFPFVMQSCIAAMT